jgi:hypothetical protein
MQQWTRVKGDAAPDDLSLALVVDAELFRLDSVIRWLDAVDGRLLRAGNATSSDPSQAGPKAGESPVAPRVHGRVGVPR